LNFEPLNPDFRVWNPKAAQASDTAIAEEFCAAAAVTDPLNQPY
jgi:hypothetical protein